MMIIKECENCKKDYMYDPNNNPEYKNKCQDCVDGESQNTEK